MIPLAAGDVFNGPLAVALSQNTLLTKAVSFACHAAAMSVTKPGAQASAPYIKHLVDFMQQQNHNHLNN